MGTNKNIWSIKIYQKKNVVYLLISLWVNRDKTMEIPLLTPVVTFLGLVALIVT